jgi:hypothetical protein
MIVISPQTPSILAIFGFFWREVPVMATMNVSLPDPMKAWVEEQGKTGQYSNASDYIRVFICTFE